MWSELGAQLNAVRQQAHLLSSALYIRIVDKGVGLMWGFCKLRAWDQLRGFVTGEGCIPCTARAASVESTLHEKNKHVHWDVNPKGQLGSLCLLGKVKSLQREEWLWRGIYAIPKPFLLKRRLRVGARAMTRFLRYLGDEIPCTFLVHGVKDVSRWWHALRQLNITQGFSWVRGTKNHETPRKSAIFKITKNHEKSRNTTKIGHFQNHKKSRKITNDIFRDAG